MSIMDGGHSPWKVSPELQPSDESKVQIRVEKASKEDVAEEAANKIRELIEARRVEEKEIESQKAALEARRVNAQEQLKKLASEALKKARKKGVDNQAVFMLFMLSGQLMELEDWSISAGTDIKRLLLHEGRELVAVRLEDNPLQPVFLINRDCARSDELSVFLQKYVKAWAVVSIDALEYLT